MDCMKINIRLHNYPDSMIALKNLKSAYIGNFIPALAMVIFSCHTQYYSGIFMWMRKLMVSFGGMTDRIVSVRGSVVKVSTVRPLVLKMDFECAKCGSSITRKFPDGKFSPPTTCSLYGCKSRNFNPLIPTAQPVDFQKIRQVPSHCLTFIVLT